MTPLRKNNMIHFTVNLIHKQAFSPIFIIFLLSLFMSNILLSRLVHPQFSFLFSNYNPAMAKTTMKAQLKLRNLQLHPNNISFFLSAFGPFQLLNGSVSSLSIKKAIILSDTTPIQVVCGDVTLNLNSIYCQIQF